MRISKVIRSCCFVAITVLSLAAQAQSFFGTFSFRTAFGFSMEFLLGGGITLFNDRVNVQVEGGYFAGLAGPTAAWTPMTGLLAYVEPVRFNQRAFQFGAGLRSMTGDSTVIAPTLGLRLRTPRHGMVDTYADLDVILLKNSILPRLGLDLRRPIEY